VCFACRDISEFHRTRVVGTLTYRYFSPGAKAPGYRQEIPAGLLNSIAPVNFPNVDKKSRQSFNQINLSDHCLAPLKLCEGDADPGSDNNPLHIPENRLNISCNRSL
jgi:hypothetical protein